MAATSRTIRLEGGSPTTTNGAPDVACTKSTRPPLFPATDHRSGVVGVRTRMRVSSTVAQPGPNVTSLFWHDGRTRGVRGPSRRKGRGSALPALRPRHRRPRPVAQPSRRPPPSRSGPTVELGSDSNRRHVSLAPPLNSPRRRKPWGPPGSSWAVVSTAGRLASPHQTPNDALAEAPAGGQIRAAASVRTARLNCSRRRHVTECQRVPGAWG